MISLEHVRSLIYSPPPVALGRVTGFCDFAGPGDESVFATCNDAGNGAPPVDVRYAVRRFQPRVVGKPLTSLPVNSGLKSVRKVSDKKR